MPKRHQLSLTTQEQEELIRHRDHHQRPDVREKAAALLKIAEGNSPHWVAKSGLLKPRDPDTVYGWLKLYHAEGFQGLIHRQQGGVRRRFSGKKKAELLDCLRQAPGKMAEKSMLASEGSPLGSRWTLGMLREHVSWLEGYTLSGVWRLLSRCGVRLRSGRVQSYSPDAEYPQKVERLCQCLRQTATAPERNVLVFLDEMGYRRWPEAGRVWTQAAPVEVPVAGCGGKNNAQWRLIGALNAMTGQVCYLDGYIVGRAKVIEMYEHLAEVYQQAETIYVVQDNWSIHKHPQVMEALSELRRIQPVWLPTYAPWLNPIEKLWRWLRQEVLKMHALGGEWETLRERVNAFLDRFASGSDALLRYVGLQGEGQLADACKPI